MKTTRSFLLLLMLLATSGLNAQKEEDKYAALVSEVRNEVWSLNLPDFKNMTVPEKYRNEPAVILAAHSRLEVTRKTKLDWFRVRGYEHGTESTDPGSLCRRLHAGGSPLLRVLE